MADSSEITESQVKAALVYKFAKFVKWPDDYLGGPEDPIVFGVVGEDVFGDFFKRIIERHTVGGRGLSVKYFKDASEIVPTHVLFVSNSMKGKLPSVWESIEGENVLTVLDEMRGVDRKKGAIWFYTKHGRVRFKINEKAAKEAGILISNQLLSLQK